MPTNGSRKVLPHGQSCTRKAADGSSARKIRLQPDTESRPVSVGHLYCLEGKVDIAAVDEQHDERMHDP